ncbi:MAG: hypothetical protein H6716_24155 [Polyangiaceae bacterium]|nr:hypothetical protein [Polyangiaceae bacterium]
MPARSSASDAPALVWLETLLWWPFEHVPVLLEVVHPRSLNALEWVLLRVVDELGDEVPPLDEVAEELGLADPVFLHDTLKDVVRLRALAPHNADLPSSDLPNLRFTTDGRRLFRTGKIEGDPAQQAVTFYFDALTGEACVEPTDMTTSPKAPFGGGTLMLEPRGGIGHDRAREIVARFHRDLLKGGGEVRSASMNPKSRPSVVWAPVTVVLKLLDSGHLVPSCAALTEAAVARLQACHPRQNGVIPDEAEASEPVDEPVRSLLSWDEWRRLAARTLVRGADTPSFIRLLMKGPREVWLHHAWLELPGMRQRLENLARGGGRVVVVASAVTDVVLHLGDAAKVGFIVYLTSGDSPSADLLVDKRTGLVRGDVVLTYGQHPLPVSLAGELDAQGCERAHAGFLRAIDEGLSDTHGAAGEGADAGAADADRDADVAAVLDDMGVKLAISRLLLFGTRGDLSAAASAVASVARGLARVEALSQLGSIAKHANSGLSDVEAHAPARAAWEEQVLGLSSSVDVREHMGCLARLAPPGALAADLVQLAVASAPSPARDPHSVAGFLTELRDCVDARWGAGAAAQVAAFTRSRDGLLKPSPNPAWSAAARGSAARQLLSVAELQAWASLELSVLAAAPDPGEFDDFIDALTVPHEVAPGPTERLLETHLRALTRAPQADVAALARAAARLLPASSLFDALLAAEPTLDDVATVHATLVAAGLPVDSAAFQASMKSALPGATAELTASAAAEVAGALTRLGQVDSGALTVGRTWAREVVAAGATPQAPEQLAEWLATLQDLLPLLDDIPALVRPNVVRLRDPLRAARAQREPVWDDVRQRWTALGLAEVLLSGLVDATSVPSTPQPTPAGQKKKRKRR